MLNSIITSALSLQTFLICTAVSVVLGLLTALVVTFRSRHTASLSITLVLLPITVQLVIMLVNGNLGAGVAVAGAFSLIRFRSVPGTAREIAGLFIAMAIGLATGMGYVTVAVLFFVIVAVILLLLSYVNFGNKKTERLLRITIPESLDYEGLFDDLFTSMGIEAQLEQVKTTNMGTLYELSYFIQLPNGEIHKQLLDEIRSRNGNLNVICGRIASKDTL